MKKEANKLFEIDDVGIIFEVKTDRGNKVKVTIPLSQVYETSDCNELIYESINDGCDGNASCMVNGFCECGPEYEDFEILSKKVSFNPTVIQKAIDSAREEERGKMKEAHSMIKAKLERDDSPPLRAGLMYALTLFDKYFK
jgi:hypothetical protein